MKFVLIAEFTRLEPLVPNTGFFGKSIRTDMNLVLRIVSISLFLVLIIAGVIAKRIYGYPGLVPAFHIPAAVALVWAVAMNKSSRKETAYDADTETVRKRVSRRRDIVSTNESISTVSQGG